MSIGEGRAATVVALRDVEKQYGGLRPLRVKALDLPAGSLTMLIGFDRPAAEAFVNLVTGASLPDAGDVRGFGASTRDLANSDEWLAFAGRFALVSERVVLLEAMTTAQNLALPFGLELDPVPEPVLERVRALADEVGISEADLPATAGEGSALTRMRVLLARALALAPDVLLLEHPSASLSADESRLFGETIARVAAQRRLTVAGLVADEGFAKATGGRLLYWQPATGEMRERTRFRMW